MIVVEDGVLLFALLFLLPLAVSAVLHQVRGGGAGWRTADRSSAGLLPSAAQNQDAAVRIFAARTVRWLPQRNTRYQAGATAYLGRTSTDWTAPASPGAPKIELTSSVNIVFGSIPDQRFGR